EHLFVEADDLVAGDLPPADLRLDSAGDPPMGQGRLLRLDLLLRRALRDLGRRPQAEDAARASLEPNEHGGPGRARGSSAALFWAGRLVDRAEYWPRPLRAEALRRPALRLASLGSRAQLLPRRGHVPSRHRRRRHVLLVLGSRVVPLRLPARG